MKRMMVLKMCTSDTVSNKIIVEHRELIFTIFFIIKYNVLYKRCEGIADCREKMKIKKENMMDGSERMKGAIDGRQTKG
jgi:hypothetical protein